MAFSASSGQPHQSPQSSMPALAMKTVNTGTWGTTGNTCVITDAFIHANSCVIVWATGTTPANGTAWSQTVAQGTVTITSSDSESSTLPLAYIVL